MSDLLSWNDKPEVGIIFLTIPATVFQAILKLPAGIHVWNDLMARWNAEDYFLKGDAEFGPPAPIGITLDFEGIDLSNQDLDGIDLRNAELSGSNFSGASLKRARLDCTALTNADFSGAMVDGASFFIASHRPGQPPQGLSPKLLWFYDVYEDDV